jgi:hypothetical protein
MRRDASRCRCERRIAVRAPLHDERCASRSLDDADASERDMTYVSRLVMYGRAPTTTILDG